VRERAAGERYASNHPPRLQDTALCDDVAIAQSSIRRPRLPSSK
jgi:hypothetical protein